MKRLHLSTKNEKLLDKFFAQSESDLTKLIESLSSIPAGSTFDEIVEYLEEKTEYASLLVNLYYQLINSDVSIDKFKSTLQNTYFLSKPKKLVDDDKFNLVFNQIFEQSTPIRISFKVGNLKGEYENVLLGYRIITDIRPIFSFKNDEDLIGTVIIHQLRINYSRDNEEKILYLSLDKGDLEDLKSIIEQAQNNEKKLAATLDTANLQIIED